MDCYDKKEKIYSLEEYISLKDIEDRFIIDLNTSKKKFSYHELFSEIEGLRKFFKSIGVQRKDEIALVLFNSIEFVLSFLSVNFNGNICLPLNTKLKKEEYELYIGNNCKYIIIHDFVENDAEYISMKKKHEYYKEVALYIKELCEKNQIGLIKLRKWKEAPYFSYIYERNSYDIIINSNNLYNGYNDNTKDVCLYLHTSGTTSKVKIVQLTNDNIKTTIQNITHSFDISENDNTLIVMPLYHVHGLIGVLLTSLYNQVNIVFQNGYSFAASDFWKNIVTYQITFFSVVPTILKILLLRYEQDYPKATSIQNKERKENKDFYKECKTQKAHKLRFIRTSSSPLEENLEVEVEEKFQTIVLQSYGMTEACHQVSSNGFFSASISKIPKETKEKVTKKKNSVGIPNVGVVIYDHNSQRICDYNEKGEICISGKNIMLGYKETKDNEHIYVYVNTKENANSYMKKNPFLIIGEKVPFFKTGDIGYIDEDNFLFISGRIKEVINRGGEKIIPNEIDNVLRKQELVFDALSFGSFDKVYGERVLGAIIPKGKYEEIDNVILNLTFSKQRNQIQNFAKEHIATFKIPEKLYFVKEFKKTDTGKLSRRLVADTIEELRRKNINVFEVFGYILKNIYHVDYIFGVYGAPINKIIPYFLKNKIYYISFRHEANATLCGNYVNFFDRKKEKVGIVLPCSGPAFINTLIGLYNAKRNHHPMILICFEINKNSDRTNFEKYQNFQYFPQRELLEEAKELCLTTFYAKNKESLLNEFSKSFLHAKKYKQPVYLHLDYQLLNEEILLEEAMDLLEKEEKEHAERISKMNHSFLVEENNIYKEFLNNFIRLYETKQKGVLIVGIHCYTEKCIKYIIKIAEFLKLPILTTPMSKSFLKENYLYNANQSKSFVLKNMDFSIAIGSTFNFYFKFGDFPNCSHENMICVHDLAMKEEYESKHSTILHLFFQNMERIVKKLYKDIKKCIVVQKNRNDWINSIIPYKIKNVHNFLMQMKKFETNEILTMEQVMVLLRKILLEHFFVTNQISKEYQRFYFGLNTNDLDELEKLVQQENHMMKEDTNPFFINQDCDISDTSSEEEEEEEEEDYEHSEGHKNKNKINSTSNKYACASYKFLNTKLKKRIFITNEGSITLHLGLLYLPTFGPFTFVIPNETGMMGVVMNANMAVALQNKLVQKEDIIISIVGDSSFGFVSNEIETYCRLKMTVILIILNNNGIYGGRDFEKKEVNASDLEEKEINTTNYYLQNPSSLYLFSKYEYYIKAHGGYGVCINNKNELIKEMKHVLDPSFTQFPVLFNVLCEDEQTIHFSFDDLIH